MALDSYIWKIYKQTNEYSNAIQEYEKREGYALLQKYMPYYEQFISKEMYEDWLDDIYCYGVSDSEKPTSLEEAKDLYEILIYLGIRIEDMEWIPKGDFKIAIGVVQPISYVLSRFSPQFFFPYLFLCRFFDLIKISDRFDIELPPAPNKADYQNRCLYYWDLCETFYRFREENNLSPSELFAFLYDFAPNFISKGKEKIPDPEQAWFIGGHTQKASEFTFWQANPDTKKGDILIHYETYPISAITSIWIAQTDGVIDPLFYYYSNTYISDKINIPHISLKELKADKYFSNHPLVRKNFQGVNGWAISGNDYSELLRIIKAKRGNTDDLPQIYAYSLPKNISIRLERDVEKELLEPLLNSMGWHEGKDFIRQMPIQAGRGHRIFLDYALHYDSQLNEEKAKVLIEAKLQMKNNREIQDAFMQARSYARLLESSVIVLCDVRGLLIYEKKPSFDRNNYKKYKWEEMGNPDKFNELKSKLNI
ncbi:type I restriction endonuclease subunit R [Bacteroides pyogenes]|uniref:type I restriction endonuclease subunit R n=1 Tax=Bacteroides pyogenes TaxID=310300 RepID=UPI001BA8A894|nr:type I restriction endonuclease subunit R [Bacteroides pyogenes]MBR8725457.1 hypothetical protein [Bacteroides pyogenes]MBR8739873.1 hypothetical protein [Bacteroides pyogenes]MBR8754937.1 hypothetical protein [Bacteroides pyogenes]MBR8795995.1 hypothetical protein [Bacteroides pyogenes]MBR8810555.1 hypothetical protein [Bacteroides pyogenes]